MFSFKKRKDKKIAPKVQSAAEKALKTAATTGYDTGIVWGMEYVTSMFEDLVKVIEISEINNPESSAKSSKLLKDLIALVREDMEERCMRSGLKVPHFPE